MAETKIAKDPSALRQYNPITLAVNVLTAPSEAFEVIKEKPSSLFPLAIVVLSTLLVTGWYFSVLDYDWYIDDTLNQFTDLSDDQLAEAREGMESLSQSNMAVISLLSGGLGIFAIYLVQAGYLSLVSALKDDEIRFKQWWSLVAWTNFPALFSALSMAVNSFLNSNGQLGFLNLNGLTLFSLGMQTDNSSLNRVFATINLPMIWNVVLLTMAYRQWLTTSVIKSVAVVFTPYLLIFGVWTYFALS